MATVTTQILFNPPSFPNFLNITYRTLCPGSSVWAENSLECENVGVDTEVCQWR